VLQWYFVRNSGAAFSMASGATWLFTLLAAIVVGAIIWQIRHLGSRTWAVFFALLLGGVLGNLTDRLTRDPGFPVGHVIDFISTPWLIPAIYNVADIAIVSAMCLFVLITLLGLPIDGSPRDRSKRTDGESASSDAQDDSSEEIEGDDSPTPGTDDADSPGSEQRGPE
jgi:signal peptidase II